MTRAAALTLAAGVLVAASAHADPAKPDRRWDTRAMFGFGGAVTTNGDLGSSASLQLDVAPKPWWYVSASAGVGPAGAFVGGAGLHLRWASGGVAVGAGAGALFEGARTGRDTWTGFDTAETTVSHYPAIAWATAEITLAARNADGLGFELALGVARPFAATAYTCMSTSEPIPEDPSAPPETYDCGGTVSSVVPYLAAQITFPPIPSW